MKRNPRGDYRQSGPIADEQRHRTHAGHHEEQGFPLPGAAEQMKRHERPATRHLEQIGPRKQPRVGVVEDEVARSLDEVDEDRQRESDPEHRQGAEVGAEQFVELRPHPDATPSPRRRKY
jgi:hypothetical protein